MTEYSPSILKGLFFQAVKQYGGVVPAGAALNISPQRVSQLQSPDEPGKTNTPTWEHVWDLDKANGHSVIFAALARMVEEGATAQKDALEEACDVTEAAARLMGLIRTGKASDREIMSAILDVQREAMDVHRAVRRVA